MPQHEPADPLHELRDRLRATQQAAERMAGSVPPAGWASERQRATVRDDLEEIAALLRTLRELVPAELQAQLAEVLRQVLLLIRALVDWWVDRLEATASGAPPARPAAAPEAQDIPIA